MAHGDGSVKETVYALAFVALALVGVSLLVHAWRFAGPYRALEGATGVVLALLGSWFSGLFHDADDPQRPRRGR